uniref:LAM_G_DOMAIN domain-containing protein n=1 Tax=Brugia pahangi TaxID=6280 RepID=A0A158PSS8_BRUPA
LSELPTKQFCENDEAVNCKNSIECIKENDIPICICRKALLPWNCNEILRNGNTISGMYIIDPDGSGSLPETYAYCENGKTIVTHNMPNNTIIHSKDLGDIHMIVNYKLFNDQLLQSLKKHSEFCSQAVRYNCRMAPLRFDQMKTWFTSISNEFFGGFGGIDGTCPCDNNKCSKCNCDNGGTTSDYGLMTGDQVPIRGIYRLSDPSVDRGYITLDPLICSGSAGQSDAYTMTIRKQFNVAEIGNWDGNILSFEFRTYLESATLLSSKDSFITITMLERTFYLQIHNQINLSLIPQSRKNDGYWHRIIVDIRDGSIRFSVDDTVITAVIKHHTFSSTYLSIGINYGTEVSFHDSKEAFLKAENITIAKALMQRIIFSFRTDQRDALLIYLHDQLYNFLQVHLSDHSHMVLTLNFNRTIYRCEVIAKIGNEYSRMKWIQVMIFQWTDSIELNVNDEICQITGERILSNNFIKKFEVTHDINDIIQPPVSPITEQGVTFSHSYVLLFVAGVPTEIHFGNLEPIYRSTIPNLLGCMRGLMIGDKIIDMRNQYYWSHYPTKPGMIKYGCELGCHQIEHLCKNGGHCSVQWTKTKNAENIISCNCARTSYYGEYCDKDNGAYFAGNSILVLNTAEIFEKAIVNWNEINEQTFSFAFSTTNTAKSTKLTKPQTLAAIHFKHNKMLQVILCKNGSINIAITTTDISFVYTFSYNYNDGYRHYFHAQFHANKSLKITIDSWKNDFPIQLAADLSLAYAIKFSFGGPYITDITDMINADKKTIKYNYTGCLSNIDIDVSVPRMRLKPILYLHKPELEFAESVTIIGNKIQLGACNSFLIPGNLPPILNTVTAPVWDSPFITESYQRTFDNDKIDDDEMNESEWWMVPFIITLILLIILADQKPAHVIKNDFALPEPDQQLDTNISTRNIVDDLKLTESKNALIVEAI